MSAIPIPQEIVENKIFLIRGQKVMMDKDLAYLYEVKPIALRQQVKRNRDHFPDDFMFQLTQGEVKILVSQNVIPSWQSLGGFLPYAFTEQGIAMLSSVLKSKRAIYVNIAIMRAFVKLRELMITHRDLARKIEELEHKFKNHKQNFVVVFKAIKELLKTPREPKKKKLPIGFHAKELKVFESRAKEPAMSYKQLLKKLKADDTI